MSAQAKLTKAIAQTYKKTKHAYITSLKFLVFLGFLIETPIIKTFGLNYGLANTKDSYYNLKAH